MDENKKYAIDVFEDGCTYEVETQEGLTKGIWNEQEEAFVVDTKDGVALVAPSCIDPSSGLVAWRKL